MTYISGYDPATGICWQFHNKGDRDKDNGGRCKCPACSSGYGKRTLAYFGRCRSGARWFWAASTLTFSDENKEAFGWTDSEEETIAAAMAAIRVFRDGLPLRAAMVHDHASYKLKEINRGKRAARPASDATDAHVTEYLFAGGYAFPIVKKTAKRVYYKRKKLEWLPEIGAPDISESNIWDVTFGDNDIGFVDRLELEAKGEVYNHGRHWSAADFHLHLKPPLRSNDEPEPPDLYKLKMAMADAHPDRGGSSKAFITARKAYLEALRIHKERAP